MLIFNKKVGETPLQMLDRFRVENPYYSGARLSYAGRLDPMAQGQSIILIDDENKDYKKYLGFDKEYEATFIIGVSTDTGDALGIINSNYACTDDTACSRGIITEVSDEQIIAAVEKLQNIKKQKYPWFSAATVSGKKLFDHYKQGNTDIDRPERSVKIKSVEVQSISLADINEIRNYIETAIGKVSGDFRQEEILHKWNSFFTGLINHKVEKLKIFKIKIHVSSGTYIRALCEEFDFPATLLKLNRTHIFLDDNLG